MERTKFGVPIIVKLRTYLFHTIIALIVLVVDIFIFQFLAENATNACAEIKRVNDAPHNEIVFSNERMGEDSFFYLKQQHLVGTKNTNVSADILMVAPNTSYENNDIYFVGTLESGTCVVSENLAREYGLRVGDNARISGTQTTFKVVRLITAQSGLDKEYLHEGIVILSYDESLLNRQYSYVSFTTDGDNYPSLISLIFIKDWKEENVQNLLIYAAIAFVAFGATMAVCEHFLFPSRKRDYRVLVTMGKTAAKLFRCVWLENVLKYILPPLITVAIYSVGLSCFGAMYAIPALCFVGFGILIITAYSLIITRKLYKCQAKIKR